MKIIILCCAIVLCNAAATGQNCPPHECADYIQPDCEFVRDGSMEYFPIPCGSLENRDYSSSYKTCFWVVPLPSGTADVGTPNYYHACAPYPIIAPLTASTVWKSAHPKRNGSTAYSDCISCVAHTGCGYSGIQVLGGFGLIGGISGSVSNRDYLCNQLVQALQPGKTYNLSMWVKLSPESRLGIDGLCMFFSQNRPVQPLTGSGAYTPPGPIPTAGGSLVCMTTGQHIIDKTQWTHLTATFTAPAGSNYSWLTIGNFEYNSFTSAQLAPPISPSPVSYESYYYIDDVSVSCISCCQNTFPFWADVPTPPSYAFAEGTISAEDFKVRAPGNSVPITEIKVTVEDFTLKSNYDGCLSCDIAPALLGSILGGATIGHGSNVLTRQPYLANVSLQTNNNEVIWSSDNGVTLTPPDQISVVYILPKASDIPCCADSATICTRITYKDIHCGTCETYNCTTVPLRNEHRASWKSRALPTLKDVVAQLEQRGDIRALLAPDEVMNEKASTKKLQQKPK